MKTTYSISNNNDMDSIEPLGLTTSSQEMWRIEEHVKQHYKDALSQIQMWTALAN